MIKINTGEISLCESGFSLDPSLTPLDLERNIPDHIVFHYKTNTNYMHYCVWLDIDPSEYVYATVCFCENSLISIKLFPQAIAQELPNQRPSTMNLGEAQKLAYSWYQNHISNKETVFKWGKIQYFSGADPIYSAPNISIQYI